MDRERQINLHDRIKQVKPPSQKTILRATAAAVLATFGIKGLLPKEADASHEPSINPPTTTADPQIISDRNMFDSLHAHPTPTPLHALVSPATRESEQRQNTQAEVHTNETSIIVDAVETYGHEHAYSQNQLDTFLQERNSAPKEQRPDTYYGSMFITKAAYEQFATQNGESPQAFLKRHMDKLSNLLKEANPSIAGGSILRELVVLEPETAYPASHHLGYLDYGLKDADGTWIVDENYRPQESAYYDPETQIDWGFLHEWGHALLHLNDQYALDIPQPEAIDATLRSQLPDEWQVYFNRFQKGKSDNDLMANVGQQIQMFTAMQLQRRENPHDFTEAMQDYDKWNAEFPPAVKMTFTSGDQDVTPESVRVYRSQPNDAPSIFIPNSPVYEGNVTKVNPEDFFNIQSDGSIQSREGTLLFFITDTEGNNHFRWMDVRDFNMAKWLGKNEMAIKLPRPGESPETFNWNIAYTATEPTVTPTPTSTSETPSPTVTVTPTKTEQPTATTEPTYEHKINLPIVMTSEEDTED